MALGPGQYDDLCTKVRTESGAVGVLLIVIEGSRGSGFSVQAPFDITAAIPTILRDVADQIARTGPFGPPRNG